MHLCYGEAHRNSREARRIYQQRYPLRHIPSHPTFQEVDRRLRETGCFKPPKSDSGRLRRVRTPNTEDIILQAVDNDPHVSTRRISRAVGVNHVSVWQTLKEQLLHPYHLQKIHHLRRETDYRPRIQFSQWLVHECNINPNFIGNILFTDEASFTRDGVFNFHNMHEWSDENPHAIHVRNHQFGFSINVWIGMVGDCLIGPFRLPNRLNGQSYLNFLRDNLNELLEDVPLDVIMNMYFMHDGAPAHFSRIVRNYLTERFENRWIGRGGPVAWPPRSPDLTPLDFFVWGYLKDLVYATEVNTEDELWQRIVDACQQLRTLGVYHRVRESLRRRLQICLQEQGRQFEHLLR